MASLVWWGLNGAWTMLRVHCSLMKQLHFQGEFRQTTLLLSLAGGAHMPCFVFLYYCLYARNVSAPRWYPMEGSTSGKVPDILGLSFNPTTTNTTVTMFPLPHKVFNMKILDLTFFFLASVLNDLKKKKKKEKWKFNFVRTSTSSMSWPHTGTTDCQTTIR